MELCVWFGQYSLENRSVFICQIRRTILPNEKVLDRLQSHQIQVDGSHGSLDNSYVWGKTLHLLQMFDEWQQPPLGKYKKTYGNVCGLSKENAVKCKI